MKPLFARHRGAELFDSRGLDAQTIRTLRLLIGSVAGGVVWGNITTGVAFSGYLKLLGASDFLYGLVMALPPLANAFQLLASYVLERTCKRKQMILTFGLMQRLIWIPFALIPYIFPPSVGALRIWGAVVMVMVSSMSGPFINVSFYSICSDVIPIRIRGRYFATRSRISTLVGMVFGVLIGFLLDSMPGFPGYTVVFIIAGIAGSLDVLTYAFMQLPPMSAPPVRHNLFQMIRPVFSDKAYMRMVLSMTAWMFSVQISAPYFNVYMLENMRLSNFQITIAGQVVSNLFLVLVVSRWGAALDNYGSRPVLTLAGFLTSFSPIIWTAIGPGMLWAVILANVLSGATYCAVDLSAQNLFMSQARDDNRSMYIAVYFFFTQLTGLALGSTVGGWLLDNVLYRVETYRWTLLGSPVSRYNVLFFLSGALRLLTVTLLIPRIREEGASTARVICKDAVRAVRRYMIVVVISIKRRRLHKRLRRQELEGTRLEHKD
jgi:MFS family permease